MKAKLREAPLYDVSAPLSVEGLIGVRHPTPGNVGVCLCGGSSRAMTAAMGQLRALRHLQANGRSLLSQVKALSVVSGGAWIGVVYTYLKGEVSDEAFLGPYVADPGRLRVEGDLDRLPEGNIGAQVTQSRFGSVALNLRALMHRAAFRVPRRQTWQTLVALDILERYGLFASSPRQRLLPRSLFSLDAETLERDVLARNPELRGVQAHLYADSLDPERDPRPFLICNASMFLAPNEAGHQELIPVQSTPLFTGLIGQAGGRTANGATPGGRALASFAFSGHVERVGEDEAEVRQRRPWSLADAVGISSAFYAEVLQNSAFELTQKRDQARALFKQHEAELHSWLNDQETRHRGTLISGLLGGAKERLGAELMERMLESDTLIQAAEELQRIIPEYLYWPPDGGGCPPEAVRDHFADAGALENTGVAGLLAYQDIDRVVAFVNSAKPMRAAERGVLGPDGKELPGTAIFIEDQVPPLFGYQPYREGIGYRLYAGDPEPARRVFCHNQVFPAEDFPRLLRALWTAIGNAEDPERFERPAIASLTLRVLANPWFGIPGRGGPGDSKPEPVTLVLVYTQRVRAWQEALHPEVQRLLGDFEDPESFHDFPHFSTFDTQLSVEQVNLLSHLTAWTVANPQDAPTFTRLFERG